MRPHTACVIRTPLEEITLLHPVPADAEGVSRVLHLAVMNITSVDLNAARVIDVERHDTCTSLLDVEADQVRMWDWSAGRLLVLDAGRIAGLHTAVNLRAAHMRHPNNKQDGRCKHNKKLSEHDELLYSIWMVVVVWVEQLRLPSLRLKRIAKT